MAEASSRRAALLSRMSHCPRGHLHYCARKAHNTMAFLSPREKTCDTISQLAEQLMAASLRDDAEASSATGVATVNASAACDDSASGPTVTDNGNGDADTSSVSVSDERDGDAAASADDSRVSLHSSWRERLVQLEVAQHTAVRDAVRLAEYTGRLSFASHRAKFVWRSPDASVASIASSHSDSESDDDAAVYDDDDPLAHAEEATRNDDRSSESFDGDCMPHERSDPPQWLPSQSADSAPPPQLKHEQSTLIDGVGERTFPGAISVCTPGGSGECADGSFTWSTAVQCAPAAVAEPAVPQAAAAPTAPSADAGPLADSPASKADTVGDESALDITSDRSSLAADGGHVYEKGSTAAARDDGQQAAPATGDSTSASGATVETEEELVDAAHIYDSAKELVGGVQQLVDRYKQTASGSRRLSAIKSAINNELAVLVPNEAEIEQSAAFLADLLTGELAELAGGGVECAYACMHLVDQCLRRTSEPMGCSAVMSAVCRASPTVRSFALARLYAAMPWTVPHFGHTAIGLGGDAESVNAVLEEQANAVRMLCAVLSAESLWCYVCRLVRAVDDTADGNVDGRLRSVGLPLAFATAMEWGHKRLKCARGQAAFGQLLADVRRNVVPKLESRARFDLANAQNVRLKALLDSRTL